MIRLSQSIWEFEQFSDSHIVSFSTSRHGGVGKGAYSSFNITPYTNDNPNAVRVNRAILCDYLQIPNSRLILPFQTHGCNICAIDADFMRNTVDAQMQLLQQIDALVTDECMVCIAVSTADCIPILLYDPVCKVVAAVHAGWRGTVKGIVLETIQFMQTNYGVFPENLRAAIGPGISLNAFEVGEEVYEIFRKSGLFDMTLISYKNSETGKYHIDLSEANRILLQASGVSRDLIEMSGICTYTLYDEFFSARRLGVNSGRILTGIMLLNN